MNYSKMKQLTSQEYVALKGTRCPNCMSTDITRHEHNHEGGFITQMCSCNDCEITWVDHYYLCSLEIIRGD